MKNKGRPARKKIQSPFSKNLEKVLAERGISQRSAAELAGVPVATLNDWLTGTQPADLFAVQKLCRAIKCNFEWMLTGAEDHVDPRNLSLSEIFDVQDDATFSGIFQIEAKRLKRKGNP